MVRWVSTLAAASVIAACLLVSIPFHPAAAVNNATEEATTAVPRLSSLADDDVCGDGKCYEAPSLHVTNGEPTHKEQEDEHAVEKPSTGYFNTPVEAAAAPALPSSNTTSSDLLPISEIVSVFIRGVDESNDNRLVRPLTKRTDKLYVSFSHRGSHRGTSLPLEDLLKPSLVNLPLLDTDVARMDPVRCTILRRRRFLPDKKLFTADVVFRKKHTEWHDVDGDGIVDQDELVVETGVVRDMKGRNTRAMIDLRMFLTEEVKATVEGNKVDKPGKVDLYYKMFTAALPLTLSRFFVGNGTSAFSKPRDAADPNMKMVSLLDGSITYPVQDEFEPPLKEVIAVRFLNWILPFTSHNNDVYDRVALRNNIRVSTLGNNMKEPPEGRWHQPLSDRSMTRLFFYHQGHFKTRTVREEDRYMNFNGVPTVYVADLTFFSPMKYRDDFDNLGCKVYFDGGANIRFIENTDGSLVFPGTPRWEHAKQKARSALFTEVALIHLNHYHLTWGNVPSQALRMFLPPSNPLRIALTAHFFRTHQTCLQARDFLVAKRGPLGRALPFDYEDGWKKALVGMMENFRFRFWPDEVKERGVDFTIGATDAMGLHSVMKRYASGLVDEAYPHVSIFEKDDDLRRSYEYLVERLPGVPVEYTMDNMKRVWGEILYRVTGGHASVGNAAIAAVEPFFVNFRQTTNDDWRIVAGSREVISTVSVITGLTMPNEYPNLATNWTHLLHDEDSAAYAQLQLDLAQLGKEITERNKKRDFVNIDFHPETAAISIFS